jgi:hypothetical protein
MVDWQGGGSQLMRGAWRWHVGVLGLYALLALAMTWPLAQQLGSAIPGDSFDGWQNVWNLWWMREAWLVEHGSAYFTSLLHAPTGVDMRFQTMAPFNGLATLPVQLTLGLLPTYNAAVLLSFVLGGYGAYLLALYALRFTFHVSRFTFHASRFTLHASRFTLHASAFLAGVIFAFSPYHFAHLLGHLQLIALQWLPFYVLYLLRGLDRAERKPGFSQTAANSSVRPITDSTQRTVRQTKNQVSGSALRDALKAGLFLILVGLVDWYYVMYCLLFTGLLLVIRLLQRRLTWRGVGVVAGAGAFFGLALSPLLLPMVQGARSWGGASLLCAYQETLVLSADLLAFITPQVFHPLWGDWALARSASFTATPSEYTVFAGFTVLLLCSIAILAMRTHRQKPGFFGRNRVSSASPGLYLLSAAFFALLALGPVLKINGRTGLLPGGGEIPLPYRLLYEFVPFVKLSRSVSRLDVMVMLFLGVGAAFGVVALARFLTRKEVKEGREGKRGKGLVWMAPVVAIGLVLFEFWPAPYPVSPPDTPAWYAALAEDPAPGAVLNLPANYERPWYLLYQTVHGKPLATGYVTRDDPGVLRERAPVLNHFWFLGPDIHTEQFDLASQGIQVLHDLLGVRWVVLDRYKMPGGPEREITDAYAKTIFAGQTPSYEDERISVYTVPEPAVRGPYLILDASWQPRQSNDAGQIWRELPAGRLAGLEVVNPAGQPLALEISAAGEGTLRLMDDTGRALGAWQLGDSQAAVRLSPAAIPPDVQTLRLVFDGAAGATANIYGLVTSRIP